MRIYLLPAWRDAPCHTDRERAALGWTEALTRPSEGHTHESAYEALKAQFTMTTSKPKIGRMAAGRLPPPSA